MSYSICGVIVLQREAAVCAENKWPCVQLEEGLCLIPLERDYLLLAEAFVLALNSVGARPGIDLGMYLSSHHLPGWYSSLADLTPETRIYPPDCDLQAELTALGWPEFFIKDYVKSLKTSAGSRISKPDQVAALIADMDRFRGVAEGGFCVRRVESFLPETERRYFVVNGVAYAERGEVPPILCECARRFGSRFYSVDVVQRADGQSRVVEVGDGKVSDLVGWTAERFAAVLRERF
jgi:hypothetical protein